jgi:hypothetical protein
MNSMSRPVDYNDKDCGCKRPKEDAIVLLKCKPGCSVATAAYTDYTLSTLTVNTKNFKDPCIRFDFASTITTAEPVTLTFQIFKKCKCDEYRSEFGPAWVYLSPTDAVTNSYNFIVCDCDCECDCDSSDPCCTYTVVVTAGGVSTISNPILSVLVVEKARHCR